MRPVRLTIQAFGPYSDREVIDFREAVEAGLFGIYGQTGSGKSTIFSAMTFALFGKPAKEDQDPSSVRSDHAEASLQTEVEFVFDIGVRRFVILRRPEQMRPKQRGDGETRSSHEAFLFDASGLLLDDIREGQRGKIIAEKKVGVVDAAVSEMLGYGPEQFRQIVLLPQGRFETFLSAKTKERLDILRDLFDVSLYRNLAAKLKDDADAAERLVRQERELCVRRLAAEGFESTDALASGVSEAQAHYAELLEGEKVARQSFLATQSSLQQAEKVEAQFKAVEAAQNILGTLQAEKVDIDRLADQVVKAERARLLADPESSVETAALDVLNAEASRNDEQKKSTQANTVADSAAKALREENGRAGEADVLRKQVEELERHQQILSKSVGRRSEVEQAEKSEAEADGKLKTAVGHLTAFQSDRSRKSEALKAARVTEKLRADSTSRLASLRSEFAAAETFEKAELGFRQAAQDVEAKTSARDAVVHIADSARISFEKAEQDLAHVQALHLASKLSSGEPCPVCGATEHPALATGAAENTGRDLAFREAKVAWQKADDAARGVEQQLVGALSVMEERRNGLASLGRPKESAAVLGEQVKAVQAQLGALGPEAESSDIEAEIESLASKIETQERARDTLRDALVELQAQTVAKKAQLDEMLSAVPEPLRDSSALVSAAEEAAQLLAERQEAKAAAEKIAKEKREIALGADKDLQAAEDTLNTCKGRHDKAIEHFRLRLQETGLAEDDYQTLKPMIATIEDNRERVEDFRRKLAAAESSAGSAADAVGDQSRPDIEGLQTIQGEADAKLTEATNLRSGAGHRRDHLTKLRDDLSETLVKLDKAEAASGPVRGLAALVNGDNPQKLDLETFTIGAMFDQVLDGANVRLGPMTANRYRLERDLEGGGRGRRGLGIQVFDIFTGKARPTTTLSGGETFIAALALALGLADVVESSSGKVRLDTIFIDEGFGSLDTENGSGTLDQVLQVLSSLVSQNRAVGLISHVPLVQEAIPNGFYIRKGHSGSSVEARGLV